MNSYIEEALKFLKDKLGDKGEIFVGFSGGKDSIVIAELMRLSGLPYTLYHSFTGIDAPEVVKFIKKNYPDCKFVRPNNTFWHMVTTKNPPANFSRWCCTELKKKPAWKIPLNHRVMGQRKEESVTRAKYPRVNEFPKLGHTHYYPILEWKEWQIWEFITAHGLEYPSLYDEGFSRIGCVVCPFHSTAGGKGHELYRKRWPKHFKVWEEHCRKWHKKRRAQGRKMHFDDVEDFIEAWYQGDVQWYKRS